MHLGNLGDQLLINVGFKAQLGSLPFENVEGWFYLTGKPNYDDAARVLSVQGIDFDLDTNRVLLDAGAAILKPCVIEQLTRAAVFAAAARADFDGSVQQRDFATAYAAERGCEAEQNVFTALRWDLIKTENSRLRGGASC